MGLRNVIGKVAGAGAKVAKAGGKVARAGARAGKQFLKNSLAHILDNIDFAGPSKNRTGGPQGPGVAGGSPTQSVATGISGQTDQQGAVKQGKGSTLSTVSGKVTEIAEALSGIRSAVGEAKAGGVFSHGETTSVDAILPIEEAIDKADEKVSQLQKIASTPLADAASIDQIAKAAIGINRSVAAQQKADAKQAEAQTLASEASRPSATEQAVPVSNEQQDSELLQPVQTALSDFSDALAELTEQIKSKGGGENSESWIDKIKDAVGYVRDTGGLARDAAGLAKTKVLKPLATLGSKAGSFFGKLFGRAGAKLTGSTAERVTQLLGKNVGQILGKSVAGAGLILGSIDAIEHAAKGDWVGLGLDAAVIGGSTAELTGVGAAPGAAVAATAAVVGVLRDGYADIFGIPPEQDPSFKDNMNMATQIGVNWVKSKLGMETTKEQAKSAQARQAAAPVAASQVKGGSFGGGGATGTFNPSQTTTPKATTPPAAPPAKPVDKPAAASSSPKKQKKQSSEEHAASTSSQTVSAEGSDAASQGPSVNQAAALEPSSSATGMALNTSSTEVDNMASMPPPSQAGLISSMGGGQEQQRVDNSGQQRTGTGIKHSPYYNIDAQTSRQFYFSNMEMGR